jgi:type III secretion protein R
MIEGSTLWAIGALAFVPLLFMATTSFVKLQFVFSILRNALGTGDVPSGAIVTALAAILTLYVMTPVGGEMAQACAEPGARIQWADPLAGDSAQAVLACARAGKEPLRRFLARNAGAKEAALFLDLARRARPADQQADVGAQDLMVVLPAFLITELKEAFQVAFLVFLPFLVVDLVVTNILVALGMGMLSPTAVSLPFKLLLFVLVDGWYVLSQALVAGYA